MVTSPLYPGDGAWRNPTHYGQGSPEPTETNDKKRKQLATIGIQRILIDQGYLAKPTQPLDGVAGPKTDKAIKALQRHWGLPPNGQLRKPEAFCLWFPIMHWWQVALQIPDNLVMGMIGWESAFDPGAEGRKNPQDRGLGQLSRRWRPNVSDETAYSDPAWVIADVAHDLAENYTLMLKLGKNLKLNDTERERLARDCSVSAHNRPEDSKEAARTGIINEHLAKYTADVRRTAGRPI